MNEKIKQRSQLFSIRELKEEEIPISLSFNIDLKIITTSHGNDPENVWYYEKTEQQKYKQQQKNKTTTTTTKRHQQREYR